MWSRTCDMLMKEGWLGFIGAGLLASLLIYYAQPEVARMLVPSWPVIELISLY